MLAGIRTFSKSIFAKIIFGVIALSFVIWGLNASMLNLGTSSQVAEIGSQSVTPAELQRSFQRSVQNMRNVFGPNFDTQQAIQMGLLNNTIQSLVSQKLLRENAKEMGIGISDKEVRDTIFASDSFKDQTTGQFSRERFLQSLYTAGYTEPEFVEGVRGDMMSQQVIGSLAGALAVPDIMAQQIVSYRNEERSGSFFALNADTFNAITVPDDATLRTYHEDNAAQFTAPESRDVTLLTLSAQDLMPNIVVSDEDVRNAYNQRLSEFQTPEKRAVEQILFGPSEKQKAQTSYEALQNGADFMQVAEDAGMDPSIVKLGEFTANDILPELRDPAFALKEGEVSQPIETSLGWHILRVPSITPESTETLDQVRDQVVEDLKQYRAADQIYDLAATLDEDLGAGVPIEQAATEVGARTYKLNGVVRGQGLAGEDIANADEINAKIYEMQNGEESFLEETADGTRYVVRIDNVTPSALRPFEDVRNDVIAAWTSDERQKQMMAKAEELAANINDRGVDIASSANEQNAELRQSGLTKRTGQGLANDVSPAVAAALFSLDQGKAKAVQAGNSVLVLKLDTVKEAKVTDEASQTVSNELKQSLNQDVVAQYLEHLRDEISVSINNNVINGLYSQTTAN